MGAGTDLSYHRLDFVQVISQAHLIVRPAWIGILQVNFYLFTPSRLIRSRHVQGIPIGMLQAALRFLGRYLGFERSQHRDVWNTRIPQPIQKT